MTVTNKRTLLDPKQHVNADTQGSLQALDGNTIGNMLVGYGSWATVKEFNAKGDVIWTARFGPDAQIASYRSFKFDWHAIPYYPPSIKSVAYRSPAMQRSTHIYVSWNGATDLARWNFFAQAAHNAEPILIGSIPKTDFETSLIIEGYLDRVSVEPVLLNGTALPRSPVQRTEKHGDWKDANGTLPVADNPSDVVPLIVDPEPVSKLPDDEDKGIEIPDEKNVLEDDHDEVTVEVDYDDTYAEYEAPLWIEAALFFFIVCLIGGTVFLCRYLSLRRKEAWYN
jgi:Arylsulfotransferase (ASST)